MTDTQYSIMALSLAGLALLAARTIRRRSRPRKRPIGAITIRDIKLK